MWQAALGFRELPDAAVRPRAHSFGMDLAVEARSLGRRFGELEAVRDVSFSIAEGEALGFLGSNGACKSTTINMLCTLLRPASGSAAIAGPDVARQPLQVRQQIGLVFQDTTLDDYLTAAENLRFHAELYGVDPRVREERLTGVSKWLASRSAAPTSSTLSPAV